MKGQVIRAGITWLTPIFARPMYVLNVCMHAASCTTTIYVYGMKRKSDYVRDDVISACPMLMLPVRACKYSAQRNHEYSHRSESTGLRKYKCKQVSFLHSPGQALGTGFIGECKKQNKLVQD